VAECTVCGAETSVSDACAHCAQPVCAAHRSPESHDCPGVDGDETRGWYTNPDAGRTPGGTGATDLSNPRRLAVGVLLVALVAVAAMGVFAAMGGVPTATLDTQTTERLLAEEVNEARTERGLAPLTTDETLAAVAESHSEHMARFDYVNHTQPDGTTIADRYAAAGLKCRGGENIYFTPNGALRVSEQAFADTVVRAWLASPGHRRALLNENYTRQGLGVVVSESAGVYVTQDFC
jgi:uncharacterized protein YkwD